MQILISGAVPGAENQFGVLAVLAILETERDELTTLIEYRPPKALDGGQNVQFTGYAFQDDAFYLCTFNEILVYRDWPPGEPVARVSNPGFNDLHHCIPWRGGIAVANTGLETVDYVDVEGAIKQRWDLLAGVANARRIDPHKDYRLVPDTKPHLVHVNHIFEMAGELWATQLRTSCVASVENPERRISMEVGMPHDGVLIGESRVFTTTNGHLVCVDAENAEARRRYDLVSMTPGLDQLGWCRGVCGHPEDPTSCFVAFTKARRTKWKEVAYWIKYRHDSPQSRICLYDLERGRLRQSWPVGPEPGLIVFQIQVLPASRCI